VIAIEGADLAMDANQRSSARGDVKIRAAKLG
jgi:hypothetical protein